jgi:histidinol-phosphate aminotransferase
MRPLVPPYIETLKPYVPGKPIEETEREYGLREVIKLASNENPLGPSPLAMAAMREALSTVHLYPDDTSYSVLQALAGKLGFPPDRIFVGAGSSEIIELLIHTFLLSGDEAVICQGSFILYKIALQGHGRAFVEVPMRPDLGCDLPAMAQAITPRTRMVFIANPDNPTGTAMGRAQLDAFLAKVPEEVFVVHDEAYYEYCDLPDYPDGLQYVRRHPNFIVLRTFAKAYGLAGMRVGYGIMDPKLVSYLHRGRRPFHLASAAQAAAAAALGDTEHVRKTVELTRSGLRYLESELRNLGLEVPRSYANFVFADFKRPALPIYEALLRRGLITRPIGGYGFPNALRISAGLMEQNHKLVAALREILS